MIRWYKVRTVAMFELFTAVKRKGYLIITFGMPIFMAIYGAIVAIPAYYSSKKDLEPAVYGVVDRPHVLNLEKDAQSAESELPDEMRRALEAAGQRAALDRVLPRSRFIFRPFASQDAAREALAARTIKGFFVLPLDYMQTGQVDSYVADTLQTSGSGARGALGALVRERLVNGRMDPDAAARAIAPVRDTRRFTVTRTGGVKESGQIVSALRIVVPLAFTVLFLMSVLMTSGYLLQGTATEKENKVVEVLLASANPDEILTGKLLGLAGAGLLQVGVWISILFVTSAGAVPLLLSARIETPWLALLIAVPFFMFAFLFFGSLMLGTGSLGSNMREAQQLSMIWSVTAALPLMLLGVLIREPHGFVARVLTWLPLTAAPVVVMRTSLDREFIGPLEMIGPLVVLIAATWLALRVGARLFRIGILSSGARPSLREVIRQARLSA
jgi:ABC-2 type transport system permease protein